ncbi:Phage portal protein [Caprobacter fermentans]|uniref:Phage portal protein n=1 Tax=Caproicibacter fermentans TaxID=2576756 RepID=A0A6N8I2I4_9FIRM|nr:phage portal protein [Caproicibacter fermentans]MVB12341.1 Phage portal protein [Caproicibacter fermentans]
MKFLSKVKTFFKNLSTLARPSPELRSALGAILSKVGIHINAKNALQVTAVFACVRLISESIASLPLFLYRKTDTGKEKATDLPLYGVLHDVPNPETDSFQFWQAFVANMLVYGRGYAEIVRNNAGQVVQLWNITTPFVRVQRNSETQELEYVVTPSGAEQFTLRKDQIFRVDWFSMDALNAFHPLELAQNAIGLGEAAEEFAADYFKNGTNAGGFITYPEGMTDEQVESFQKQFRGKYEGLSNSARLIFLEQGSQFQKASNTPEESQMLETRKFQVEESARFYNVPLHMIGDLDHATFSNIEQMSLNFVIYTLRPYLVRIERAIVAQLLTPLDQQALYTKFSVDALLRGSYLTRMQGYAQARQNGWMNANEIRDLEDMDSIPDELGGNAYLANSSLRSIAALAAAPAESTKSGGDKNGS